MSETVRHDRRSLRWKLPWLFALTASLSVATFGIFAWLSARAVALDASGTRLRSALSQVRTVMELGVENQLSALRSAATDTAIRSALRSPAPVGASALRSLRTLKGASDSSVIVALIDRYGTVRATLPDSASLPSLGSDTVTSMSPTVGPLVQYHDALAFESSVAITDAGLLLGRVVVVRPQRNAINRRMTTNQVPGSVLITGNAGGTMWGPSGVVDAPGLPGGEMSRYRRDGERWIGVAMTIRGSPWQYALELPERLALAPANALLLPFLIAGLLVAAAGAFIGLRVSRRITTPLADLTVAAESLARGERHVRLAPGNREDEIGRLARAFGTMAENVTTARERLQAEVDARTGELTTASQRLRALHDELRTSEKLAMLGRLSGSVGHELRNPLGVMSNVVFLIDTLPEASDRLREYVRQLRDQIRVSDRIISDLLDRARSGQPVRSVVHVPALLDEILLRAAVPHSIAVRRQYAADMPRLVLDRDHLAQILWNLVRNALQAMHDRTGVLTLGAVYAEGRLRLEVRDSGDGIPAADADRIFEPLYTTRPSGIGLGLSVSRAFARASGGDLTLAPVEGGGACFVLELPADVAGTETVALLERPDERRARRQTPPPHAPIT